MNTMANRNATTSTSTATVSQKENAVNTFTLTVNGVTISAPTQEELLSLAAKLNQAAPVVTEPQAPTVKAAKKAEDRAAYKLFSWLDKKSTVILTGMRDKVLVPSEIYLADNLIPDLLTQVSKSAGKVETFFGTLKTKSAAKPEVVRPQVSPEDAALNFKQKVANLVASDPQGAAMHQTLVNEAKA